MLQEFLPTWHHEDEVFGPDLGKDQMGYSSICFKKLSMKPNKNLCRPSNMRKRFLGFREGSVQCAADGKGI